jgi:hypothetical protein
MVLVDGLAQMATLGLVIIAVGDAATLAAEATMEAVVVPATGNTMRSNSAFENGRADKQRAFCLGPWRRAAQRER